MNNVYFHHWVADTVANLSGNRAACLQYLERECALTSFEARMDACQALFDPCCGNAKPMYPAYSLMHSESVH